MDRATGRPPNGAVEATGEFDLGDEDIIADGGTQIMSREPFPPAVSGVPAVPKPPSSLDALAATIPARNEPTVAAASNVVPTAPPTEPIHELDPDDLEEEEQRRIERTQPFDRSRLFGAPGSGDGAVGHPIPAAGGPVVEPGAAQAPAAQRVQTPSAAWLPGPAPRLDLVVSPTPAPVAPRPSTYLPANLPSVVINDAPPPQNRPASIAPLTIDVAPARALPDATLKLPPVHHVAGIPKSNTPLVAAAIAGGLALCAAAVIGIVSFTGADSSEMSSKSTPTVAAKPREAQKGAVRSAVIETPETTPQKAAAPPGAEDEDGTPVYSPGALPSAPAYAGRETGASPAPAFAQAPRSPATTPSSRTVKPAAPVQPATASEPSPPVPAVATPPPPAPARPAAPPPTTGTIEVPASLMTVMVDGDYKRVHGGRIVVSCGKHRVNAGRGTQVVEVPCGGVASVM